jgi:hypothetical protein
MTSLGVEKEGVDSRCSRNDFASLSAWQMLTINQWMI